MKAALIFLFIGSLPQISAQPMAGDWPVYGRDPGGQRYSPLKQINTKNVDQLQPAWTYHTREDVAASSRAFVPPDMDARPNAASIPAATATKAPPPRRGRPRASQATPIVINHVMYLPTAYDRVVALDPETGKEIWKYQVKGGGPSTRGVAYWPGDKQTPPRIVFGTNTGKLIVLDAKTGQPILTFGNQGEVDLRQGVADKFPNASYGVESPPVIYKDLAILGSNVQETPSKGARGDMRAFNVRTGKLVWTFHTVPLDGEAGAETWETPESRVDRSGTNDWGFMTLDAERGVVYVPLGSPSYDFYGADRLGKNLYANCLVALNASTGKLVWHFQFTHHDLWDYDPAAPPALVEVTKDGKKIPAVVEVTKMGLAFFFDRRDGKPVFGIEERAVPKSLVPGEVSWPTQPFPIKPKPLTRVSIKREDIATVTSEHKKFCEDLWDKDGGMHNNGPYTTYNPDKTAVIFPGTLGGANWGGVSFDPTLNFVIVNTMDLGQIGRVVKQPEESRMPYSRTSKFGPFGRFWNPDNFWPCQQPPWGQLQAINTNTGEIAWSVTLGITDELEAKGVHNTGALSLGGPISTAGGLTFIAATNDSRFRAFDSRTGKQLWVTKLDAGGHATPITYQGRNGKQYVLIVATGSNFFDRSTADTVVAFALPDAKK